MKLYDKSIEAFLQSFPEKASDTGMQSSSMADDHTVWPAAERESLILRSDMAYELGGGNLPAVSGIAYTHAEELAGESGVWLLGPDLQEIRQDSAYGRMVIVRLREDSKEKESEKDNELYRIMRNIDYTRYHIFPRGFALRISSVKEREAVRISKEAMAQGISLISVGQLMLEAYRKHPEVEAVQIYFFTSPDADYTKLQAIAREWEAITSSTDHIFKGLIMDCGSCGQKELCDRIEGMKEMHQRR